MRWDPHDVMRLVALIGAFALAVVGAVMMMNGVAAEGAIDIKSTVLSGSLKTGSAGLFIVFLAFFIIAFVVLGSGGKSDSPFSTTRPTRFRRLLPVFFGLLIVTVGCTGFAAAGMQAFAVAAFFFGVLTAGVAIGLLTFLAEE